MLWPARLVVFGGQILRGLPDGDPYAMRGLRVAGHVDAEVPDRVGPDGGDGEGTSVKGALGCRRGGAGGVVDRVVGGGNAGAGAVGGS